MAGLLDVLDVLDVLSTVLAAIGASLLVWFCKALSTRGLINEVRSLDGAERVLLQSVRHRSGVDRPRGLWMLQHTWWCASKRLYNIFDPTTITSADQMAYTRGSWV